MAQYISVMCSKNDHDFKLRIWKLGFLIKAKETSCEINLLPFWYARYSMGNICLNFSCPIYCTQNELLKCVNINHQKSQKSNLLSFLEAPWKICWFLFLRACAPLMSDITCVGESHVISVCFLGIFDHSSVSSRTAFHSFWSYQLVGFFFFHFAIFSPLSTLQTFSTCLICFVT